MMILIAGPYRSGTNDDSTLMRKNLDRLESVALPLFRMGHIPMIGEWVALPLLHLAGSKKPGTKHTKRYYILQQNDCSQNVMQCFVFKENQKVQMRM